MTRRTNARVAGFTFLFYIAAGIVSLVLAGNAPATAVLTLLTSFSALVLGVTLYAITREQDPDLATLALVCRVAEGVLGALFIPLTLGLLSVATAAAANTPDVSAQTLATFVLAGRRSNPVVCATFFAVGSTLFCWLLLRGRIVPTGLAWLGVLASALLVLTLPLQLAGLLGGPAGLLGRQAFWVMWFPMLVFELALAGWLLVKGVAVPTPAERE